MNMTTPDFSILDCVIKHYSWYVFNNYKNITIDNKSVAAVLKLITPAYTADLTTALTTDGLNLYVYQGLHKYLKSDAVFLPLAFWNNTDIVAA